MVKCTLCDDDSEYTCGGKEACHPAPGSIVIHIPAGPVTDEVLGNLFDAIQDAIADGNTAAVDAALIGADVSSLAPETMVAMLTYSFCANEWLPTYGLVYQRIERELAARGIDAGSELAGLQPRRAEAH
jgi:hypothetical protein